MADLMLPDPRMEMPDLLVPGRKPVGLVEIDWSHPMTRGLRAAFIGGVSGFQDAATGLFPSSIGGSPMISPRGDLSVRSGDRLDYGVPVWARNSTERTIVTIGVANNTTGLQGFTTSYSALASVYMTVQIKPESYFVYYFRDGLGTFISFGTPVAGQRYAAVGISRAANDHHLYIDSKHVGSSTASVTESSSTNKLTLGMSDRITDTYSDGELELSFYFDRGLSHEEAVSISHDPTQFMAPR